MSGRTERNAVARARLEAALPPLFPGAVLAHARGQTWVPNLPRLAMESYWRGHPARADRLARALAARSGAPDGWRWTLDSEADTDQPRSFRMPPAPYRDPGHGRGPGHCCICGQPVFRFGWHEDLWATGRPNPRARWHAACVAAWKFWLAPNTQIKILSRLQARRCAVTGQRLLRDAEADHRVPLFRVWRQERDRPWPELLSYWGWPNLQAVNRPAHRAKTAGEARSRAGKSMTGAPALEA
ncbi:hypothetical protein P7D22_05505 [Lichenihabitans sp. Uapishka_5]|uniref:hypothetical protein n=1 Tax=Lichenihabitans sp. Uapishka_5 TaxID=3037302 RepID=UPI0029E81296|nr:hypothetical protein [Lichenihabitans sp. Uapishka_5]MDX7950634.1 hypothetical protein [Lichenihabitans sp. Uapishka_5]